MFNSRFNKPDGTSLHKITNETHLMTLAGDWINVTTGQPQRGFHVSNLRNRTKHTLLTRI